MALAWALLSGLVLPSSVIASSVQEFSDIIGYGNPRVFLLSSFWQAVGLFLFWPICIFFLFREKVQALMVAAFSVGLVCALLNAFVFTGNYGSMDVSLRFPDGFVNPSIGYMLVNLAVLVLAAVLVVALLVWNRLKLLSSVCLVATISFVLFGLVNISIINKEYRTFQEIAGTESETAGDIEPVYRLSKTGRNVIVLMLDRVESSYFESILADQPEIGEAFTGFVYYKNALAYNSHTLIGSPPLHGGYEYTPYQINVRSDKLLKDKHNEALLLMPRIFTEEAGFSATLSDTSWGNYSYYADMRFTEGYDEIIGINLYGKYSEKFKKEFVGDELDNNLEYGVKRNLLWVSLFREMPCVIRPAVYYRGSWWNNEAIDDIDFIINWYAPLHYLTELTTFDGEDNSFLMITNDIVHSNEKVLFLDLVDPESVSYPNSPAYDSNTIAYKALAEWFDYLKGNGVYDNTRIIIVSDHGMGYGEKATEGYDDVSLVNNNKDHFHAMLLFKDFGSTGELKTDMTFMTNADVPTMALDGIVDSPVNPFTGNPVNSEAKGNGVYITTDDIFMPYHSKSEYVFTVRDDLWYHVKDNIFIDSNWTQEVPQ